MTTTYDDLAKAGGLGRFRRDVVLEAVDDLEYIENVYYWFAQEAGSVPEENWNSYSVRFITELIDGGWCRLATWGKPNPQFLDKTAEEIAALIDAAKRDRQFTYFLWSTEKAHEWAKRYYALIKELAPPRR